MRQLLALIIFAFPLTGVAAAPFEAISQREGKCADLPEAERIGLEDEAIATARAQCRAEGQSSCRLRSVELAPNVGGREASCQARASVKGGRASKQLLAKCAETVLDQGEERLAQGEAWSFQLSADEERQNGHVRLNLPQASGRPLEVYFMGTSTFRGEVDGPISFDPLESQFKIDLDIPDAVLSGKGLDAPKRFRCSAAVLEH